MTIQPTQPCPRQKSAVPCMLGRVPAVAYSHCGLAAILLEATTLGRRISSSRFVSGRVLSRPGDLGRNRRGLCCAAGAACGALPGDGAAC